MSHNLSNEFSFLKKGQVFGEENLKIFQKYGTRAAITDFSILLGGVYFDTRCLVVS